MWGSPNRKAKCVEAKQHIQYWLWQRININILTEKRRPISPTVIFRSDFIKKFTVVWIQAAPSLWKNVFVIVHVWIIVRMVPQQTARIVSARRIQPWGWHEEPRTPPPPPPCPVKWSVIVATFLKRIYERPNLTVNPLNSLGWKWCQRIYI